MNEGNNLINRVLYLCFDKWNIELKGRDGLKEFLEIMLSLEPKSIYLLNEIINFDGLVMSKGVIKYIEQKEEILFMEIAKRQITRMIMRESEETEEYYLKKETEDKIKLGWKEKSRK